MPPLPGATTNPAVQEDDMARRRSRRKAANDDFPTDPIVIALTPAIKAKLKRKGRFTNKRMVRILRVVYKNGKVTITSHRKGPGFVPSNACFA
jgi:hypothetical protein